MRPIYAPGLSERAIDAIRDLYWHYGPMERFDMAKSLVTLVGNKHRGRPAMDLLATLPNGEPLTLIREPTNQYDPYAVQVWARGLHIGFVKKEQNHDLAARIDKEGEELNRGWGDFHFPAKLAIDGSGWPQIEID
jgi:hypothetical protein